MTLQEAKSDFFSRFLNAIEQDDYELQDFLLTISPEALALAHTKARRGKRHYTEVQAVNSNPNMIADIYNLLVLENYEVSKYKLATIKDPKERILLKLPYYPDRIIQWALMQYLEPIFMDSYHPNSCASISGRGIDKAFNLAKSYTQELSNYLYVLYPHYRFKSSDYKFSHCLKIDIRHFYQSISHSILKQKLSKLQINPHILKLLNKIIDSSNSVPESRSKMRQGYGIPIGSYVSQHLANLYLTDLDNFIAKFKNLKFVRYMDDYLIFGDSHFLHELRKVLSTKLSELKLEMKGNWQIYNLSAEGIDFVGYHIYRRHIRIRNTTAKRLKKTLGKRNFYSYKGVAMRTNSKKFLKKYFCECENFANYDFSQNLRIS